MSWVLLAVAIAGYLFVPQSSSQRLSRGIAAATRPQATGINPGRVVFGLTVVLLVAATQSIVWPAMAIIIWGTSSRLWRRRWERKGAEAAAADCARASQLLATLVRAGQLPNEAIVTAAQDYPVLGSAAALAKLGGEPAQSLKKSAESAGKEGLATIGAALQLSERSGAPIADVLLGVSSNLRHERHIRALVQTELAAARTGGQIMALLPVLALGLGFLAGTDPLQFLFGNLLGQSMLLLAVGLCAVGVLWIDWLAQPEGRR